MKLPLVSLAVWLLAVGVGGHIARGPAVRSPAGATEVWALVLGEARTALGNQMLTTADQYFHGGVVSAEPEDEDEQTPATFAADPSHPGSDASAKPGALGPVARLLPPQEPDRPRANWDWWTRINRQIRPRDHRHLKGERFEKEILPWVWAATRFDPHNIMAYQVGAYWLARRLGRADDGLRLIEEGIRRNATSHELEFSRGEILLHACGDADAAFQAFLLALRKWQQATPSADEDAGRLTCGRALLYLADLSRKRGDLASARSYCLAAAPVFNDPQFVAARLAEIEAEVQAKNRPPSPAVNRGPDGN